jgi:hypothetical protein
VDRDDFIDHNFNSWTGDHSDIGPHGLVRVAHGTGAAVSARVDRHVAAVRSGRRGELQERCIAALGDGVMDI